MIYKFNSSSYPIHKEMKYLDVYPTVNESEVFSKILAKYTRAEKCADDVIRSSLSRGIPKNDITISQKRWNVWPELL